MKRSSPLFGYSLALSLSFITLAHAADFRAGAYAQDITPLKFPISVNGNFKQANVSHVTDPMHARSLALHDGEKVVIFCVVDSCMIPREICEATKDLVVAATQLPRESLLISATHTHTAATMAAVFQSEPDAEYLTTLPERIAKGMIQAYQNLETAEIGWEFIDNDQQVFNRRWLLKDGESYTNPFGGTKDRVLMNPGVNNPQVASNGPVDPELRVIAVRSTKDQRPLAVLTNYSLHYVGGVSGISADYYGAFAAEVAKRLQTNDNRYANKPAFVGMMSNGCSGDINNIDFSASGRLRSQPGEQMQKVANSLADSTLEAYGKLVWRNDVKLDSLETDIDLTVRKGDAEELKRAHHLLETTPKDNDGQFSNRDAIYARETVLLNEFPDQVPVKLQVHRIDELSIAAIPCEVFAEIGLNLKAASPFKHHFTFSLANGYNGYLPQAKDHALGGYETWRARSSYLEVNAAEKISNTLIDLLNQLKKD